MTRALVCLVVATAGMGICSVGAYAAKTRTAAAAKTQAVTLAQVMAKLNRIESALRRESRESSILETQLASIKRQNSALAAYVMRARSGAAGAELASDRLPAYGQPEPMPPQFSTSSTTTAPNAVMQTQVCVDGDLQGRGEVTSDAKADGEAKGNLGVEAYGNGGEGALLAKLGLKLEVKAGGDMGVSVHRCLQFNTFGILDQVSTQAVDTMVADIDSNQAEVANGLVQAYNSVPQLGNAGAANGMIALTSLNTGVSSSQVLKSLDNPASAFQQYANLVSTLPLPGTVAQLLTDPSSLFPSPQLLTPANLCGLSSNGAGLLGSLCAQVPSNLLSSSGILNAISQLSNVQGALANFQATLGTFQTGATNLCNSLSSTVSSLDATSLQIPGTSLRIPDGVAYNPPSLSYNVTSGYTLNNGSVALAYGTFPVGPFTLANPFQLPAIACPTF